MRAENQDGVVVVNLPVVAVTVFVQQRVAAQPAARHLHEREEIEGVVQAFEEADLGRVEQGNDGHRRAGGDSAREAAAGSGGQVHCAHTYHAPAAGSLPNFGALTALRIYRRRRRAQAPWRCGGGSPAAAARGHSHHSAPGARPELRRDRQPARRPPDKLFARMGLPASLARPVSGYRPLVAAVLLSNYTRARLFGYVHLLLSLLFRRSDPGGISGGGASRLPAAAARPHRRGRLPLRALDRSGAAALLPLRPMLRLGLATVQPARPSTIRERLGGAPLLRIALSGLAAAPALAVGTGGMDRLRRLLHLGLRRLLPPPHLGDRSPADRIPAQTRAPRLGPRGVRADPLLEVGARCPLDRRRRRAAAAHGGWRVRIPPGSARAGSRKSRGDVRLPGEHLVLDPPRARWPGLESAGGRIPRRSGRALGEAVFSRLGGSRLRGLRARWPYSSGKPSAASSPARRCRNGAARHLAGFPFSVPSAELALSRRAQAASRICDATRLGTDCAGPIRDCGLCGGGGHRGSPAHAAFPGGHRRGVAPPRKLDAGSGAGRPMRNGAPLESAGTTPLPGRTRERRRNAALPAHGRDLFRSHLCPGARDDGGARLWPRDHQWVQRP